MKLGLFPHGGFDPFDDEAYRQVKDLGFTGIGPYIPDYPEFSREQCAQVRSLCEQAGLDLVELAQYDLDFISRDPAVRRGSEERMKRALERAAWMGCPVVITGSGSLNPARGWFDHPDNHSWQSFDFLVRSLREVVKTAADVGVAAGLECHTNTALDSPEKVRDVLDAVGSPVLKVDLDPVNWITYATYWHNGPFLHHMFDLLGDVLLGGHAKDVCQEDGLIVHLSECPAGEGNLDYGAYLTRMTQLDPDIYLVMEATSIEALPAARDYILREADKAGVAFVS